MPVDGDSFEIDIPHQLRESSLQSPTKEAWSSLKKKADQTKKSEPPASSTLQTPERTIFLPTLDNSSPSRLSSTPLSLRPCPTICEGSPTEASIMSPSSSLASPFPMKFRARPPTTTESQETASAVSSSSRIATVDSPGRMHTPLSPMAYEGSSTEASIMSPSHSLTSPFPMQFKMRASVTESQATASVVSLSSRVATVDYAGSMYMPLSPMACEVSPTEAMMSPSHSLTSPFPMQFRMRSSVSQSQAPATAVSASVRLAREGSPGSIDSSKSSMTAMPSLPKNLRSKDESSRFSPLHALCSRSDRYLPAEGHSFEIDNPHRLQEPGLQEPTTESMTLMQQKDDTERIDEPAATVPRATLPERVQFTLRPRATPSLSPSTGVSAPVRYVMDESRETINAPLSPKGIMLPHLPKKSLSKDDRPPPCPGRVASPMATTLLAKNRRRTVGRLTNRSHIRSTPMMDYYSDEEDDDHDE